MITGKYDVLKLLGRPQWNFGKCDRGHDFEVYKILVDDCQVHICLHCDICPRIIEGLEPKKQLISIMEEWGMNPIDGVNTMKLGKLFSGIVKIPLLPIAVVLDVVSLGANAIYGDSLVTEKTIKAIADDLDEATE